jgi:hypothetical protein
MDIVLTLIYLCKRQLHLAHINLLARRNLHKNHKSVIKNWSNNIGGSQRRLTNQASYVVRQICSRPRIPGCREQVLSEEGAKSSGHRRRAERRRQYLAKGVLAARAVNAAQGQALS